MPDPIYFHADCNSFFASVEETFHPEYKKVPMAVAGDPASRHGIILAKNELAKGYGIKTAETISSAKRKCPELLLCPPRRGEYGEFCDRINAIYETYSNFVERFSIDESFLDMTFFRGDELTIAHEIRERVARETGITISIGVSWNRTFAKMGSDYKKPNAVTHITRENYRRILWPLPVGELFGVGRKMVPELDKYSIRTIGDLANTSEAFLLRQFGKQGEYLHASANGLDDSPIARTGEYDPAKSIGNGKTFRRDLTSEQDIRTGLIVLADSVAARMRRAGVKCTTVQVTIKDSALKSITRQKTVRPTYLAADLVQACLDLIHASWPKGKPIRLLTITAQNLLPAEDAVEQLSLFDAPGASKDIEQLERAVDGIRERYGGNVIQHGSVLRNDLGIYSGEDE
ncbi:MAG: DNA polymerase IV [Oscillospiraceae bacterium]|nr:DNA polymerase IV [Oscillospiraceae bacterium]